MNEKGYGVMSIKKEVIEEIKNKAKEEKTTISDLLSDLLKQLYSNKEEKEYSNDIATDIKEELKKEIYSNRIAIENIKKELKTLKGKEVKHTEKKKEPVLTERPKEENNEVIDKYAHFKTYTLPEKKKVPPARPF